MSGMFSMGGPPVVIYFMQSEDNTDEYMATISAYFVLSGVIAISMKAAAGFITVPVWISLAVGVPAMLLGSFVGKRTRDHINAKLIKRIVYGFMATSGIIHVVTSLV